MVDELYSGRVTSFRREQGFGVITLDDGRDVKFDASDCTMVPEEGAAVRLRIGPARWGGGIKALHVEPRGSSTLFVPVAPASLDEQIAALQREHLIGALSEQVLAEILAARFGGRASDASVLDVLDVYYTADAARARNDGYVRLVAPLPAASDALAAFAAVLPGAALPRLAGGSSISDAVKAVNQALAAAGDPRRLYAIAGVSDGRAFFALAADRAKRLEKLLPLV